MACNEYNYLNITTMKNLFSLLLVSLFSLYSVSAQDATNVASTKGCEGCPIGGHAEMFKGPHTFKFQGDVNVGVAISHRMNYLGDMEIWKLRSNLTRPLVECVMGVAIDDYLFVGGGLGLQYYAGSMYFCGIGHEDNEDPWNTMTMPLFVNIKSYVPHFSTFKPYLSLSVGGTAVLFGTPFQNDKLRGGFYCDLGTGFHYSHYTFTLGWQHQQMKDVGFYNGKKYKEKIENHAFYIKLGYTF